MSFEIVGSTNKNPGEQLIDVIAQNKDGQQIRDGRDDRLETALVCGNKA